MNNKINYVLFKEMADIKQKFHEDESFFIAEIDGNDIKHLQDYLTNISDVFKFPFPCRSIDSYNDWMRDLDWLEKEGYVLIIYNFKDFLSQDLRSKKIIIDGFEDLILLWWQEGVEKYVVEGKIKPFYIYFVE